MAGPALTFIDRYKMPWTDGARENSKDSKIKSEVDSCLEQAGQKELVDLVCYYIIEKMRPSTLRWWLRKRADFKSLYEYFTGNE